MTDAPADKYDLILWGASGYTGRLVAEYLTRHVGPGTDSLRWAIAGRNRGKLKSLRSELATVDPAAAALPILIGDSHDSASLEALVSQTRVVCSTAGPYALIGTPLLETCVRLGRDYCDLTGEKGWIRANVDRFHAQAIETGARIVHSCGFDSIPSDLGCLMMHEQALAEHGRPCAEITTYVSSLGGGVSGGTLASGVHVLASSRDPDYRRLLADPYALVPAADKPRTRQPGQVGPLWAEDVGGWTAPFVMARANMAIVHRTNALLGYRYGQTFRYAEVVRMGPSFRDWLLAAGMSLGLGLGFRLGRIGMVRSALQRWVLPALPEGPSREQREKGHFTMILVGRIDDQIEMRGRVVGQQDPGYGETAKMLGESALCLALDRAQLPPRAGILTPAAAMGDVLIERLRTAGMTLAIDTTMGLRD